MSNSNNRRPARQEKVARNEGAARKKPADAKSKWPMVRLGEVLTAISRAEKPMPGTTYRQVGVRLWGEGAYERESIDGASTRYAKLHRTERGDVVVNKIWARNGSVAVVSEALAGAYASAEFPVFVPNRDRVDPRWIHWLTKTKRFWSACDEKSRGSSGKNRIRPEQFLTVEIPLPPLSEQRRIVTRIETLSDRLNAASFLCREAKAETEALRGARLSAIFGASDQSSTIALQSLASLERGKFSHRPRNDPRFFGGTHPWIQIGEIESSGKYIEHWSETLNDAGLAISKKFPKGTLLVSIAATIGAVGILGFDCCLPDSIVAICPNRGTDPEFLFYYLKYVRNYLERVALQSAQKNINLGILSSLPVPSFPLSAQRFIVAELDSFQTEIDGLQRVQNQLSAELDALLPSILDRAFKGEL